MTTTLKKIKTSIGMREATEEIAREVREEEIEEAIEIVTETMRVRENTINLAIINRKIMEIVDHILQWVKHLQTILLKSSDLTSQASVSISLNKTTHT
jgi:hypothetical protein